MARRGSADASESGLAVNWTLTALCMTIFVGCFLYTQLKLLHLKEEGHQLQILQHPHLVTILGIASLINQAPLLIGRGADVPIPCPAYILIQMFSLSIVVAIIVFSTLLFTQRLAQVQCFQQFVFRNTGGRSNITPLAADTQYFNKEYQAFVKIIANRFRGYRIHFISMTVVIIGVSLSFIRPNEFLMEDDCNGQTQLFLIIVWLGFVIPYFCYLRTFFVLSDPYQVLLKLKIETVACIVVGVLSIVWAIYHESVSESHSALIYNKLFWITQMSFWYAESYIPLKLTQERIRENKLGKSLDGPTLLETLSDARLLRRFAQHLIKEWSIENLDFLKASLLHQFETTRTVSRILKLYKKLGKIGSADKEVAALEFTRRVGIRVMTKSWKIYNTYIADTATTQVTLGNAITSAIHRYFEKDCFFDIRLNEEDVDSTSSRVFESKILESNRARNGGVPRTPDRKIARKDKPESGVVGAEEKTTIHKFQTIGRVSKDDEDSIPTVKPFLSAKRSSNDPNHVERVELRDLVIDMGRRQVTTDTTISKDITMSEKSRHFTIDTTMSKDMNMSEMTVDTLDRHKRPVKKSSRAHPTWVSQQLILEKNESKNIGSENTTPKSSRTNSGKSQQGRIDTSWNPTDCKRDVASPRSVESSRTNSPSRSRSIHKHIRPHDLKAFCAVISTASMEDFDNSSVCAELGETVAALRKLLSMKSQMDAKEALERGPKGSTRMEIMQICTDMMECSQIFDAATKSVFHLLETDSHRRFVLKLLNDLKR